MTVEKTQKGVTVSADWVRLVEAAMKDLGMSRAALQKAIGVSRPTVWRLFAKLRSSEQVVTDVARAVGLPNPLHSNDSTGPMTNITISPGSPIAGLVAIMEHMQRSDPKVFAELADYLRTWEQLRDKARSLAALLDGNAADRRDM